MLIYILSIVFTVITLAFITGGSICLYVNHDRSPGCYYVFGIGISLLICIIATCIFSLIMKCIRQGPLHSSFVTSGPFVSSGPLMQVRQVRFVRHLRPERLSSSPSSPSKILVIRKKP